MPASKAQRAATAERRSRAIAMRIAGVDYDTIARQLGYADRGSACKDVSRALEQRTKEQQQAADSLRTAEVARLDRLQAGLWTAAAGGDARTVEVVLKVIDRRIKLLGLDQAQRILDNAVDAWLNHLTAEPAEE
jgi:hypothetical protein